MFTIPQLSPKPILILSLYFVYVGRGGRVPVKSYIINNNFNMSQNQDSWQIRLNIYCIPFTCSVQLSSINHRPKGLFILHRNCVAVLIYWLLSAASHRSFNAFQLKMNLTFMWHHNAVLRSQFLCSRGAVRQCNAVADVAISKCPLLFTVWTQLHLRSHQNFYEIFTRKQFLPTSAGNAQAQLHFCG